MGSCSLAVGELTFPRVIRAALTVGDSNAVQGKSRTVDKFCDSVPTPKQRKTK